MGFAKEGDLVRVLVGDFQGQRGLVVEAKPGVRLLVMLDSGRCAYYEREELGAPIVSWDGGGRVRREG